MTSPFKRAACLMLAACLAAAGASLVVAAQGRGAQSKLWYVWEKDTPPPTWRGNWLYVAQDPPDGTYVKSPESPGFTTAAAAANMRDHLVVTGGEAGGGLWNWRGRFYSLCDRNYQVWRDIRNGMLSVVYGTAVNNMPPSQQLVQASLCCEDAYSQVPATGLGNCRVVQLLSRPNRWIIWTGRSPMPWFALGAPINLDGTVIPTFLGSPGDASVDGTWIDRASHIRFTFVQGRPARGTSTVTGEYQSLQRPDDSGTISGTFDGWTLSAQLISKEGTPGSMITYTVVGRGALAGGWLNPAGQALSSALEADASGPVPPPPPRRPGVVEYVRTGPPIIQQNEWPRPPAVVDYFLTVTAGGMDSLFRRDGRNDHSQLTWKEPPDVISDGQEVSLEITKTAASPVAIGAKWLVLCDNRDWSGSEFIATFENKTTVVFKTTLVLKGLPATGDKPVRIFRLDAGPWNSSTSANLFWEYKPR
jgi:hypothetical protein